MKMMERKKLVEDIVNEIVRRVKEGDEIYAYDIAKTVAKKNKLKGYFSAISYTSAILQALSRLELFESVEEERKVIYFPTNKFFELFEGEDKRICKLPFVGKRKIVKIGSSYYISIPNPNVKAGDVVWFIMDDDKLLYTKDKSKIERIRKEINKVFAEAVKDGKI